jgi:hypothetical protein
LAVQRLRRDLERLPAGDGFAGRLPVAVSVCHLTRELEELIEALDRRAPLAHHAGEAEIARDAAALRAEAAERLAELLSNPAAGPPGGRGDLT